MIRKNYMITPRQSERLKEEADKEQISISEMLRKILDAYFRGTK